MNASASTELVMPVFADSLDAIADRQVAADADLAAEHHAVADHGAAGNADLRRQQRRCWPSTTPCAICTRLSIFVPGLDARLADRRPIDRRVGADLDVVFDHHRRRLRNLFVRAVGALREAVAVAADHRAVLDDHARADRAALAD